MTALDHVCSRCFENPGIRLYIDEHSVPAKCSFCPESLRGAAVAPFVDVVEHIRTRLFHGFDDATDWMYLDSDTKEPMNVYYDSWEIIEQADIRFPEEDDGRLSQALSSALSDDWWSEPNPFGISSKDQIGINWDWFCEVVKHQRRFFFHDFDDGGGFEMAYPTEVLIKTFEYADSIGLFTTIPERSILYRTRREDPCNLLQTHDELGIAPREFANSPNRMSPAGIPMFYASDNIETALRETAECRGLFAAGRFETLTPMKFLDLSMLPPTPDVFQCCTEADDFCPREPLTFLNHVVHEMALPVKNRKNICFGKSNNRNDKAHIDYIPTQVVTEFVRSYPSIIQGEIDGIKYPSAVHQNHYSVVIFDTIKGSYNNFGDDLDSTDNRLLKLVDVEHYYVSQRRICNWFTS